MKVYAIAYLKAVQLPGRKYIEGDQDGIIRLTPKELAAHLNTAFAAGIRHEGGKT